MRRRSWRRRLLNAGGLLVEEIAAVGDAAVENNGGEIRAVLAFAVGPGGDARNDGRGQATQSTQQGEISAHGAKLAVVLAAFGAEMNELPQAGEVVRREGAAFEPGDFNDARREFDVARGGENRAAIKNEELQEHRR